MNEEVYRRLDKEEIITKDHYYRRNNKKLVLLPFNHSWIGKKVEYEYFYEKISLDDFRLLKDDEILNEEHFQVWRVSVGYLRMVRIKCYFLYYGSKAGNARKANSSVREYNIYAKQKTQFNFETLNILKDIQL
jgi:hypothetical protein